MNIGIYFNPEETKWIKEQPEGTVRELVQREMGGHEEATGKQRVVAQKSPELKKGIPVGLHTCKQCGSMLPYFKGKCKRGCK